MPASVVDELLAAYAELKRSLSRRLGNVHDAQDLAQSSFERVYAHALTFPIGSPRALLFRVAQNLCIDQGRRAQAETRLHEAYGLANRSAAAPSAERVAAERQALEAIVARLARLPRRRREVFILVRAYGYTHAEVGERLGISLAAVEKHVVRATLDCSDAFACFGGTE